MTVGGVSIVAVLGLVTFFASLLIAGMVMRVNAAAALRMRPSLELAARLPWSLFVDALLVVMALVVLLVTVVSPTVTGALLVPLALVALFPYPFVKVVLIPLGQAQTAYHLALLSCLSFWDDRRGGAVGAGAWALLRRKRVDGPSAAFLEQQLAGSLAFVDFDAPPSPWARRLFFFVPAVTRANALFGGGLLAAARGDLEGARAILARLEDLPASAVSAEARRLALSWRCADAAERGDWVLLERLGGVARQPFLEGAARRLRGAPDAPDDRQLCRLWRESRQRSRTAPLLARALAAREAPPRPAPPVPASPQEALAAALAAHLAASREAAPDPVAALTSLAAAWDAVLGDATLRASLTARARALGVVGEVDVVDELAARVDAQLAELARRDEVPLEALQRGGGRLRAIGRALRDRMLGDLESSLKALRRRIDDDRRLPGEVERREFEAIVEQYRRLATFGGLEVRRLAFSQVHPTVCSLGVWLWNERRQRRVGNAIFRFLFMEALVLDDESALMLQAGNVRAGAG